MVTALTSCCEGCVTGLGGADVAAVFEPGDHGSTYSGTSLATAAVNATMGGTDGMWTSTTTARAVVGAMMDGATLTGSYPAWATHCALRPQVGPVLQHRLCIHSNGG